VLCLCCPQVLCASVLSRCVDSFCTVCTAPLAGGASTGAPLCVGVSHICQQPTTNIIHRAELNVGLIFSATAAALRLPTGWCIARAGDSSISKWLVQLHDGGAGRCWVDDQATVCACVLHRGGKRQHTSGRIAINGREGGGLSMDSMAKERMTRMGHKESKKVIRAPKG